MTLDYYTAPSQEIFDDIKSACILIWLTYDNTYGYASEKTEYIEPLQNIGDNCLVIVNMFDVHNMRKLLDMISADSRKWLEPFLAESFEAEAELKAMGIIL